MAELQKLSASHCVLLAVHYATESNLSALQALTALRGNEFELELTLRILLTYLPEIADASKLTEYLHELVINSRSPGEYPTTSLDLSSVQDIPNSQARKKRRKLELLPLAYVLYKTDTELDPLTHFLIHRAHRIDADTGLLDLIPPLVAPFLDHSEHLRTWFISIVLPLVRLGYEYYPQNNTPSLEAFTKLQGRRAVEYQLSYLKQSRGSRLDARNAARDLRGVVGPWICGASERKRRKLSGGDRRASMDIDKQQALERSEPDDWECLFEWLAQTSKEDFPLVTAAISEWDGPDDLDLGGYDNGYIYINEDQQRRLEVRYAQTALASLYLVDSSSPATLQAAHSLLVRLTSLLNLDPPLELSVGVDLLPSYDLSSPMLEENTTTILQREHILRPDNQITQPSREAIRLLELFLFSASLLSSLQYPISVRDLARLYLRNDASEQSSLLHKILHTLNSGSTKDGEHWKAIRLKLLWLWDWGTSNHDGDRLRQGVLGQLEDRTIETEILDTLLESNHYALAIQIYVTASSSHPPLSMASVEEIVLKSAMHNYDNASNGNRTRGGMRKASDIVKAFSPYFTSSLKFQRLKALLDATHSMSFYTLILQHGVPFQPVNIRVSADPLSLLRKLLSQNSRSYTHLDDLISIGQNLVVAMPATLIDDADPSLDPSDIGKKKATAERRVIGMAIEAALDEDDFETAYSYVVNRLSPPPSTPSPVVSPAISTSSRRFSFGSISSSQDEEAEDVSWRAALLAGRYHSSPSTSWSGSAARPDLRRLEQRMELLSQALLLAPPYHLEEVLAVWQQCEGDMNALLAEETEAEERFNDLADRKLPGSFANETVVVQPRREVGRGAVEESPMGLFDVARGAAAAFSKSAFPLRSNTAASRSGIGNASGGGVDGWTGNHTESRTSMDLSDSGSAYGDRDGERVRRRDMVASAVTGGLASGLGWVLGAKPVQERERE